MNDQRIIDKLREEFKEHILGTEEGQDFLTIEVTPHHAIDAIGYLFREPELKFQFLTSLFAVHYPHLQTMQMVYLLHRLDINKRLRIKTNLSDTNPEIGTLTKVFAGANWMERETYDFFGVNFIGHPNLKRILNVEDMIMYPMRKEFPLEDQTRGDKKDEMFGR